MLTTADFSRIRKILKEEIKPLDSRLGKVETRLDFIEKDVKVIRKQIKIVINFFDRDYLKLLARIERIEAHLNLPPPLS